MASPCGERWLAASIDSLPIGRSNWVQEPARFGTRYNAASPISLQNYRLHQTSADRCSSRCSSNNPNRNRKASHTRACSAHSRARGNPEQQALEFAPLGPRFRGDERD